MTLPAEILATIPEDIRGSEHIASYNDVGSLVKDLIGAKTADWRGSLPDDLKAEQSLAQFKDLPSLAKSYVETKKMVGSALKAPAADASDEDWDKFYRLGGKPETPDLYKIDIPAEIQMPPEVEKRIRVQAHKMGLNGRQTQSLINEYSAEYLEAQRAAKRANDEIDEKLQKDWGGNYKRNMALIDRTLDQVDPTKELRSVLEETGLIRHPAIVKHFHEYSKKLVEGGFIPGDVDGIAGRDEARAKISQIMADPKHPWHTSKPGDHVREEVTKLHQIAYD